MPLIQASIVQGRSPEQIRALHEALTKAVETSIGASRDAIRVLIYEVPATHWAAGGVTIEEKRKTSTSKS
ncbi:MAG: 4-oxalocrotonate tautomerase [Chloroflexi bacterium]|nr:MAG: 4-oxalocrotonate tautomerase [Chloroflexota bacterium]